MPVEPQVLSPEIISLAACTLGGLLILLMLAVASLDKRGWR